MARKGRADEAVEARAVAVAEVADDLAAMANVLNDLMATTKQTPKQGAGLIRLCLVSSLLREVTARRCLAATTKTAPKVRYISAWGRAAEGGVAPGSRHHNSKAL